MLYKTKYWNMKALIIEDHPISAMGLKMAIEDHFENAKVESAYNGKEAKSWIKNKALPSYFLISAYPIPIPNL